jgi:hypothetical protein
MNLMNMVRLCGVVAVGWTLMALGVGVYSNTQRPAEETNYFSPQPALHDAVAVSQSEFRGVEEYRLVDRSTGHARPLPLPDDANWGLLTVSPWRDQEGNLEAVGRWTRPRASGDEPFCGLGLFRVSDAMVVQSVDLDVLPTGRPCPIPGLPGDFLFPAGDGQLHRCHLTRDRDAPTAAGGRSGTRAGVSRPVAPHAVTWQCAAPGTGRVFMYDPVWPSEPQFRKFVLVSLSAQKLANGKRQNEPARIWWLEMSEQGDEILSAGPLTAPPANSAPGRAAVERMPSVTAGPSGRLSLAYLTRAAGQSSWRLRLAGLSLDQSTGKPVVANEPAPAQEVTTGIIPSPPTFSADGQAVFAPTTDGRIKKYTLATLTARTSPVAVH